MKEVSYDSFIATLRSALHYLYEPVHLRNSALVELLGLEGEFDRASALQELLIQAIRSLKPSDEEAPQSRAWRVYDALNLQYIRQVSRDAVAMQLGISERQLRREQRIALEVLAQQLWPRTSLQSVAQPYESQEGVEGAVLRGDHALNAELQWLEKGDPEQAVPLGAALQTVLVLAQPLAEQSHVRLQLEIEDGVGDLLVAPLPLRTMLLTLLSVAIGRAKEQPLMIRAGREGGHLQFQVSCDAPAIGAVRNPESEVAGLEAAQNLAHFYGAELSLSTASAFAATLRLDAPEQTPVLVIDDNADWLALLQRYAVGSRYRVIGAPEGENACSFAEKVQPAIILLDVMMHNVDGWQILSELRHDPLVTRIPVVISTVLPVEELARSLGANGFMQKPVTRQQFLQTLDQGV